jgi:hypothetical protein
MLLAIRLMRAAVWGRLAASNACVREKTFHG